MRRVVKVDKRVVIQHRTDGYHYNGWLWLWVQWPSAVALASEMHHSLLIQGQELGHAGTRVGPRGGMSISASF